MIFDSAARPAGSIVLLIRRFCRGALCCAPVIKNFRDVDDLVILKLFGQTQPKVMILGALITFTESTSIANRFRQINSKVTYEVLTKEKLRIPVRLEIWIVAFTRLVDLVFV